MKLLCFVLSFLGLSACYLNNKDNSLDLGDKYRFIPNAPARIIYYNSDVYSGIGFNAINPEISQYASNNKFILAVSYDDSLRYQYWIIDKKNKKEKKGISVDSSYFYSFLEEQNLALE